MLVYQCKLEIIMRTVSKVILQKKKALTWNTYTHITGLDTAMAVSAFFPFYVWLNLGTLQLFVAFLNENSSKHFSILNGAALTVVRSIVLDTEYIIAVEIGTTGYYLSEVKEFSTAAKKGGKKVCRRVLVMGSPDFTILLNLLLYMYLFLLFWSDLNFFTVVR